MNQQDFDYIMTETGLRENQITKLFLKQLSEYQSADKADLMGITDAIKKNECIPCDIETRGAEPFTGAILAGYWKIHYFHPDFLLKNIQSGYKQFGKKAPAMIKRTIAPHVNDRSIEFKDLIGKSVDAFFADGWNHREQEGNITGEWIIFKNRQGINYYLCLAKHDEPDETIRYRLDEVIREEDLTFLFDC